MSVDAIERIKLWRERPDVMVRELFHVEPDPWQLEGLKNFKGDQRQAYKACKGPGKTAYLAWICWNFLLTRPHPKIAATSISGDNLQDNLWSEMAKWQERSPLLKQLFCWTKTRIYAKDHEQTWWMSARTWSRNADASQQANTLAGLHADYLLFVIDESGGIPDAVMAAAEAGLSVGEECKIVQCGNPTHLEGPLYRACTADRHLWRVVEITGDPDDPNRSPRISVKWAREQIESHGRHNPWVLVNVFGQFPPESLNALIGPEEVRAAMKRRAPEEQVEGCPRILGVDVGRFGDDPSVIFPRQGKLAQMPMLLRNVDSIEGASHTGKKANDWCADCIYVDDTGGFGGGWVDQLKMMKHKPMGIAFSNKPLDPRYFNKRAEMWFNMVEWIKDGGELPDVPELVGELSAATYHFKGDKLILDDKDQIKAAIGRSPNYADALALTFAMPNRDNRRARSERFIRKPVVAESAYNPHAW